MMDEPWHPNAGDLIWTDFNPTNGGAETGRHPALVVSPKWFTVNTGLAVVCPITSHARGIPTSVPLPPGLPVSGEVLTSHLRSIDTLSRPVTYAGATITEALADEVRAMLAAFVTI